MTVIPLSDAIAEAEFARLDLPTQLARLRSADARLKSRLILKSDNAEALVRALPLQEVYLMIREVGGDQLPELAALAPGEQWTGFFDLDCWDRDRFIVTQGRGWLTVLMLAEEKEILEHLRTINFETLVLLLKSELKIIAGPESIQDEDARLEAMQRDGGYQVEFYDAKASPLYERLFTILFHQDPGYFRYLLEAVRGEDMSLVEESVYQQRSLRLMDLGFPDPESARAIYAWTDPERFLAEQPPKASLGIVDQGLAPSFPLQFAPPDGLLGVVLAPGASEETAWELVNLVNRLCLADDVPFGDIEQVREVVEQVNATVNLALEWLVASGRDANEAFGRCYLQELFRLGFSLTLTLQRRAYRIAQSAIAAYLDESARSCLEALALQPPRFLGALDDPLDESVRLFSRVDELDLVSHCLGEAENEHELFAEHLTLPLPEAEVLLDDGFEPKLTTLFLTALANRLLGREFSYVPIAVSELAALHAMVSLEGVVQPALRRETENWLESLCAGCGAFADRSLDALVEGFCSVRVEDLDPRYLEVLLVERG